MRAEQVSFFRSTGRTRTSEMTLALLSSYAVITDVFADVAENSFVLIGDFTLAMLGGLRVLFLFLRETGSVVAN